MTNPLKKISSIKIHREGEGFTRQDGVPAKAVMGENEIAACLGLDRSVRVGGNIMRNGKRICYRMRLLITDLDVNFIGSSSINDIFCSSINIKAKIKSGVRSNDCVTLIVENLNFLCNISVGTWVRF